MTVKEQVKARPILFNGDMVRAILDGRKTQTRRVVKNVLNDDDLTGGVPRIRSNYHFLRLPNGDEYGPAKCPHGLPGDTLWVRETWATTEAWDSVRPSDMPTLPVWYCDDDFGEYKKRPSIFMPRWASRITLKVTGVRVERVQDISEEDAKAEGVEPVGTGYVDYSDEIPFGCHNARESFFTLWESINAKRGYGWDTNPWCWVVEFERVQS